MPTDLILICHGQPQKSDGENHYGWWADMPLSHRGKQQAMLLAERLRSDFDIRCLYTSPQKCAHQTAEWIGDILHIVPDVENDLRELESGDLATLTREEVRKYYPGFFEGQSLEDARVPGSETYADLHTRVANTVSQLVNEAPDQQIACITHVRPIVACLQAIMGYTPEDEHKPQFACHTAAIHHLQLNPGGEPTFMSLNDISHLADLPK